MKNLFRSTWFIAVLALVLGLGTQIGVLVWRLQGLESEAAVETHGVVIPDRVSWTFLTPEIDNLREDLQSRLAAVGLREQELDAYEKRLLAERAEVEKLKRDIEAMRTELSTTITDVQASEQKNLKTLAATYTGLTPAGALAIFRKMDDEMVVKILTFMKPDPVGQILEEMARTKDGEGTLAGRAAALSDKLRLVRQVKAETSQP